MKTMKDFSALQLSKKQMNSIVGGATYDCYVDDGKNKEFVGTYKGSSAGTVESSLKPLYGNGVSCS